MRRVAAVRILLIATISAARRPRGRMHRAPTHHRVTTRVVPTPLGWYAIGSIACAAVSPMVGTLVLGRELTVTEVDRMALSCFLGPVGWLLGPVLFPDPVVVTTVTPPGNPPPQGPRLTRGRHIDIPRRGVTASCPMRCCWKSRPARPTPISTWSRAACT